MCSQLITMPFPVRCCGGRQAGQLHMIAKSTCDATHSIRVLMAACLYDYHQDTAALNTFQVTLKAWASFLPLSTCKTTLPRSSQPSAQSRRAGSIRQQVLPPMCYSSHARLLAISTKQDVWPSYKVTKGLGSATRQRTINMSWKAMAAPWGPIMMADLRMTLSWSRNESCSMMTSCNKGWPCLSQGMQTMAGTQILLHAGPMKSGGCMLGSSQITKMCRSCDCAGCGDTSEAQGRYLSAQEQEHRWPGLTATDCIGAKEGQPHGMLCNCTAWADQAGHCSAGRAGQPCCR